MTSVFGAKELRRAALASLDALRARQVEIDRANVYPIPDGDTGTNLVLTMESVARALEGVPDEGPAVAHAVTAGSLMGARGNSGVILAQFLRGLCETLGERGASAHDVALGLKRAADLSYEAMLTPVEGTMLTVARAAADAAGSGDDDLGGLFAAATEAARGALARTPDLLPVLKEAGVVDAGGMGLVAVLEAFADSLAGRAPARRPLGPPPTAAVTPPGLRAREAGSTEFAHEVQYLLVTSPDEVPALREALGAIGDSVAVVGGGDTWKVHVHTNDVGRAIELGMRAGSPSDISVVTFEDQVVRGASASLPEPPGAPQVVRGASAAERPAGGIPVARPNAPSTLVAVAHGEGVRRLFAELGASVVLDGGPTMSPSVGEILDAIEAAPAENVIVLPNSDNVLPAALQAAARSLKRVHVLPSSDVGQGLAAAVAFGDSRSAEHNVGEMAEALERVRSGRVGVADRDAATPAGPVRAGQAIGFAGKQAVVVADDPVEACAEVVGRLTLEGGEVVTVVAGADADPEERRRLAAVLGERFRGLGVEILDGGQPHHRYVVSVE